MSARQRNYINRISAYRHAHHRVCQLHEDTDEVWTRCNARRPNGVRCDYKATELRPGYLPTCGKHLSKELIRGECKAILACGQECRRSFHWTPYHNPLCPAHEDLPMPCYLLELPLEVRQRIYSYALPRKVDHDYMGTYHAQRFGIFGLLHANRQISQETLDLLYRETTFAVIIEPTYIQIANRKWHTDPIPRPSYTVASQIGFGSNNFSRLRSLDFELKVYGKGVTYFSHATNESITLSKVRINVLRFIGLLAQSTNLKSLSVKIQFCASEYRGQLEMVVGMKPLLNAFSGLRRVLKSNFTGFVRIDGAGNIQGNVECPDEITDHIPDWKRLLTRHEPNVPTTQCLQLFWKIEDFINDLVSSHIAQDTGYELLIQRARVAQQTNELSTLTTVRDLLDGMWEDYLDKQTKLEQSLQKKCDGMYKDDRELLHPSLESEDGPVVRAQVSDLHAFGASVTFHRIRQLKVHWPSLPQELR